MNFELLLEKINKDTKLIREHELLTYLSEEVSFELLLELSTTLEQSINSFSFPVLNQSIDIIEGIIELLYQIAENTLQDIREKLHLKLMSKKLLTNLADIYEQNGCVGAAFDYLVKVIDPNHDITNKQVTQIKADNDTFLLSIELGLEHARSIYLYYCSTYFTVISVLGHVLDEALEKYKFSRMFARIEDAEEIDVRYWCSVSSILFRNKTYDSGVVSILKSFLKSYHPAPSRMMIIEALLRYNQLTGTEQASLFKEANKLKLHGRNIITKKALKFWSCLLTLPASSRHLLESFINLLTYINDSYKDVVQQRLQKTRISWVINEVIFKLLSRDRNYKLAFEIAYRWQTNKTVNNNELPDDHLFILTMATMEANKCWYLIKLGEIIRLHKFDCSESYSDFINKKNEIESSWMAMLEEKDSHTPVIPGNPNIHRDISTEYEEYFSSIYCIDNLLEVINTLPTFKEVHIFELSSANVPIQPFLSKSLGGETPVSLLTASNVSKQRDFKKALFWIDPDQSLYMAEKERDAILFIAREQGVTDDNIIIRYQTECKKEEFLQLYSDPTIDLIWISGHGTRDSNNPQMSSLKISDTEEISLGELANIPVPGKELGRRLLVLNMCETASVYIRYNSMNFLSISSVLSNQYQSVLGHLWPTNYLTSATFGTLLFSVLMKEQNWTSAVAQAQHVMSSGSSEIIHKILQDYPTANFDLLERIQNQQSIEMDIIANWGSSSFHC